MPRFGRDESGQVAPLFLFLLTTVLIAMLGLVVDVGSWYRAQRHVQAVADAAALAGVQALPGPADAAVALAREYAQKNDGSIAAPAVTQNRIDVVASAHAPSYFTRMLGFDGIDVHASAHAEAVAVSAVANAAPLAIPSDTPALACGAPCFGDPVTVGFGGSTGAPGAFGLVDFSGGGGVGTPVLASWISNGYPGTLPLGSYTSAPGNRWNAGPIESALEGLDGSTVLVPVYDGTPQDGGAGATYHVVGWAAFHFDSYDSSTQTATGEFVQEIEHGTTGQNGQYYGVKTVHLTGGGNGNGTGNCRGNGNAC